jgi:hypothetical protein
MKKLLKGAMKIAAVVACVGLFASVAKAVDTNVTTSATAVAPYYSITNMALSGGGVVLASDPVVKATTNSYTPGTNFLTGAQLLPFGFPHSRYVAFGLTGVSTNTSANGTMSLSVDLGTGNNDWKSSFTISATLSGTNVVGTSTNIDTGGYTVARINAIGNSDATYGAYGSASYSCKPGI